MGGIDLTFSGTEHPLLHLLPLTRTAIPPLVDFFYLYGELLSLPLSRLRERCFFSHSRIPAGLPRYPRGYSPPFSVSTRPFSRRPQRRTTSNVKKLEAEAAEVVCLIRFSSHSTSLLFIPIFFADLHEGILPKGRNVDGKKNRSVRTA